MKKEFQLLLFGSVFVFSSVLFASTSNAVDFYSNITPSKFAPESNHGWRFSPTEDIAVTELGLYDFKSDGLLGFHEVGIFDLSGHLITSTVIEAGDSLEIDDSFRWKDIPDVFLSSSNSYIMACYTGLIYDDHMVTRLSGVGFHPLISYETALWGGVESGGSFQMPTHETYYDSDTRIGPNFRFEPIPEPTTLSLLALGAFLAGRKRRRK